MTPCSVAIFACAFPPAATLELWRTGTQPPTGWHSPASSLQLAVFGEVRGTVLQRSRAPKQCRSPTQRVAHAACPLGPRQRASRPMHTCWPLLSGSAWACGGPRWALLGAVARTDQPIALVAGARFCNSTKDLPVLNCRGRNVAGTVRLKTRAGGEAARLGTLPRQPPSRQEQG